MADKQIKDYTTLPLADTDSLIKQSVAGATGKTTLADIKSNLDGRYQKPGVVVWEDSAGSSSISCELVSGRTYAFVVNQIPSAASGAHVQIVAYNGSNGYLFWYSLTGTGTPPFPVYLGAVAYMEISKTLNATTLLSGNPTTNVVKVYKIIDLGEVI